MTNGLIILQFVVYLQRYEVAVSGVVTHTKISDECIAKKRWLRGLDIPRIQKISDTHTIKKRWLRGTWCSYAYKDK